MSKPARKLAFIGIRGIPFTYSGFEEFALQLGIAFANKNWRVIVYCRSKYFRKRNKINSNIKQVYLPTIYHPAFETIIHSFLSTLHACFINKPDVILYFGIGSTIWSFLPRLFNIPTVVNVDGLDWKRKKWSRVARRFLYISECFATFMPSAIVSDSLFIQNYFEKHYRKKSYYISYFFKKEVYEPLISFTKISQKYDISKNGYLLWVGRIVPDNNIEELIEAYSGLKSNKKLVIIGDDLYQTDYKKKVRSTANAESKIIFTGFLRQTDLIPLYQNSYAYVETKRSSGTHPSLLEALTLSSIIISNNAPANKMILQSSAFYYDAKNSDSLQNTLKKILLMKKFKLYKKKAVMEKILYDYYSEKSIVKKYEKLFSSLIQK